MAKQQLCMYITLFCTFPCRHCTTITCKCLNSRFVEDGNIRQKLSFSFPEIWCIPLFDATRIDFFSDAFVAFAVVVAYAVSIPAAPSLPPPPPGYCGAFAHLFRPGDLVFVNFALPGAGHLPTPGLFPSLWHARGFLSEYNNTEDITGKKKQIGSSVNDRRFSKAMLSNLRMHLFIAYISRQNKIAKLGSYRRESTFFG